MARFFGKALQLLARIYPLTATGVQTVDQLDMQSPITLVHDVAREVELAAGGMVKVNWAIEVAADATTYFDNTIGSDELVRQFLFGGIAAAGSDEAIAKYRSWITHISARPDHASLTPSSAAVVADGLAQSMAGPAGTDLVAYDLLFYSTTRSAQNVVSSIDVMLEATFDRLAVPRMIQPGRVMIISARSSAGGGAGRNLQFTIDAWVGPIGVLPPGL